MFVVKIPADPEEQINKGEVGAVSEKARDQFLNEKDMLAVSLSALNHCFHD